MRTVIISLLFFLIQPLVYPLKSSDYQDINDKLKVKKMFSSADTAEVNRYTRKALNFSAKIPSLSIIKANIDTAEMICEQNGIEIPALLHLARAEYFFLSGDYNNSSQEATIAMKLSKTSGDSRVLAKTMQFLGKYCTKTGFFKEAIDYYTNTINIAEKNRLKGFIPKSYYGMAIVYDALADQKQYRLNLTQVIIAAISEKDTASMKQAYFNLGSSYTNKERDFKAADSLLRKGYEISLLTNDTSFMALTLANQGWNNYLEKKYSAAISAYNQSLSYSIPGKRYTSSANSLGNLGTIYRDLGEKEKSLKYYQKSIEQGKQNNDVYNLQWVYMDLSEMYLRLKDTANAYLSYVLYKKYSDQYILKASTQGLSDARIKYEADTHNKELELMSLKLRNQQILIYGFSALLILCLAIGILLFSRSKINAKRRLAEMNRKISEVTQANLRQQMNPHFIFNTLNSIQYYMYQHDKLATNNYLTKFSSLMRKVLENSQHTSVPLRDELDALNLYLELEMIRFKDKFDYEINIDDEIDTIMYKVPTMLIQPYVENSICHGLMPAEVKGHVKIDLKLEKNHITCTIEDNGIGREAAQVKKKNTENGHSSLGTQIISSRLELVNALYGTTLKTIYTDLKNDKGEPEGTRVEIHIPILS
jgi:tetratricopeptide (TPR) repeat protein